MTGSDFEKLLKPFGESLSFENEELTVNDKDAVREKIGD